MDELEKLWKQDGWWKCAYCSVQNWDVYHRPGDNVCPKTNKPRLEAEEIADG